MIWKDSHVEIDPPKKTKKLTATRFASVLGLNPWSTPFEIWCAVTKTYEKPFEDTIYTKAGKAIEPKQIAYMRDAYMMSNLRTPTDVYGPDYFKKTWGDFFPDVKVFGGMWDSLLVDGQGKPSTVIEFKTTKRSEDWSEDIPEYYALQAALYAYLLGVDNVVMVCSFLDAKDYEDPEKFVPSVSNTITREFKVSNRYPAFDNLVMEAEAWWKRYVKTGISPDFDEKKDAEILQALRTSTVTPDEDVNALIEEAELLKKQLDDNAKTIKATQDRLTAITDKLKEIAKGQFKDGDTEVLIPGSRYVWKMTRTMKQSLDEKRLKEDGLYQHYLKAPEPAYRMTCTEKKKEE